MVHNLDTFSPPHTILRGKTYYLNIRVPKSHQQAYGPLVRAKLSNDVEQADNLAKHLANILKQNWSSKSNSKIDIEKVIAANRPRTTSMTEIAKEYIAVRRIDPAPVWVALKSLFEVAGDRPVTSYTRDDARAFLRHLQYSGNKTSTIRKRLSYVSAFINYAYQELEIDERVPFSRIVIPAEGEDAVKRGSFTIEQLRDGYSEAMASPSHIHALFPILGETGCRLAEIVGLKVNDVDFDNGVLHIAPNEMRRLKTAGSQRGIPLAFYAHQALLKAKDNTCCEWLFPMYIKPDGCYATHASNTLAKWTKRRWGLTAHSLRHTFRDRLRAIEAPLEAIDQLGGWSSISTIGSKYGQGYSIDHLKKYVAAIEIR